MTRKSRRVTLGVAALLTVAFGAVGISQLGGVASKSVAADDVTLTVDAIGNLDWTATDGATAYTVAYTVGSDVTTFTTETNTANVGVALTKAVQAAKDASASSASVTFKVTPNVSGAATAELVYTFDKYIDYGYSKHDITDYTKDAQGDGYEFGSEGGSYHSTPADYSAANNGRILAPGTMWKNDLMTIGLNRISYAHAGYYYTFALFGGNGSNSPEANKSNYHLILRGKEGNAGTVAELSVGNAQRKTWSNAELPVAVNTNYTRVGNSKEEYGGTNATTNTYEIDNYFTLGVFDVFDLTGEKAGEHFYFDCDMKTADGEMKDVATISEFFATDITASLNYTNDAGASTIGSAALTIAAQFNKATAHSGEIEEAVEGIYYDNTDATLNWNAVEDATGYEYAVDNGAWTATTDTCVDFSAALTDYNALGYVPVRVRAVKDGAKLAETEYNVRLGYGARSTVKDLYVIRKEAKAAEWDNVEATYTGGWTRAGAGLTTGNYVTFSFVADSAKNMSFALFGSTNDDYYYTSSRYFAHFWKDGFVTLGKTTSNGKTSAAGGVSWTACSLLEEGTKYFATFGVDNVYAADGQAIVAERVVLQLAIQDGYGFKTVLATSYDNTECAEGESGYVEKSGCYMMSPGHTGNESGFAPAIVWEKKAVSIALEDGVIGANAYMHIGAHKANVANMQMKITYGEATETVAIPTAETSGACKGLYKFSKNVPAKAIDENVTLELIVGGQDAGVTYTFDVREYIDLVQADTTGNYSDEKDLVTAIEDYCEAAAVYYGVENAAITDSSRISAVDSSVFNAYAIDKFGSSDTVQRIGLSLLTEDATTIRLYIQTTEMPNVLIDTETAVVNEVEGMSGYYYVDLAGVSGFDLTTTYTFTVNDMSITCNALSYGKLVMDNQADNANLVNVVKALYNYSVEAAEWKAAQAQ